MKNKIWTDEEIQILIDFYISSDIQYLYKLLPNKSRSSINHKANRLGLHKSQKDITGNVINNIMFEYYIGKNKHKQHIWLCRCFCGKTFKSQYSIIKNGYTKSCGCIKKQSNKQNAQTKTYTKDITKSIGYQYPELLQEWDNIIDPFTIKSTSHMLVQWRCIKCQFIWKCAICNRTRQNTGCPQCNESKGEKTISKILDLLNIKYRKEYKFIDCKFKRYLPFDFYLPEYNLCIEFQGSQHYTGWRTSDPNRILNDLSTIQIRDSIKRQYCQQNGIHLIEIPYTEFKNLELIITNIIRSFTEPIPQGNLL